MDLRLRRWTAGMDGRRFARGAILGAAMAGSGLAAECWLSNNVGELPGMQPGFYRSTSGHPQMEWRAVRDPDDRRRYALSWECDGAEGGVLRLIGYESRWSTPAWRNRQARWTEIIGETPIARWIWTPPTPDAIETERPNEERAWAETEATAVHGSHHFSTVRLTDTRILDALTTANDVRIEDQKSATAWTATGHPLAAPLMTACRTRTGEAPDVPGTTP